LFLCVREVDADDLKVYLGRVTLPHKLAGSELVHLDSNILGIDSM